MRVLLALAVVMMGFVALALPNVHRLRPRPKLEAAAVPTAPLEPGVSAASSSTGAPLLAPRKGCILISDGTAGVWTFCIGQDTVELHGTLWLVDGEQR